jgi:hypothetical protein
MNPLSVVLLLILIAVLVFLIGRVVWRNKRAETAEAWPTTEATVQSGEEVVASTRGGEVTVFCFAFSYVVNAEYYSGRFELLPTFGSADAVLSRMKDRKFQVHYDPAKPETYRIPDEQMEGCDING